MSSEVSLNNGQKRVSASIVLALLAFAIIEAGLLWYAASNPQGIIGGIYILNFNRSMLARGIPVFAGLCLCLLQASFFVWKLQATSSPSPIEKNFPKSWLWLLVALGTLLGLAIVCALRAYPISSDEFDYIFQAKTYLSGHLYMTPPPYSDLFTMAHIIAKDGRWVSQYQPGWPLMLAAIAFAGLPMWLTAPLCGGAVLALIAATGAREYGREGGWIAAILLAVSPFFVFNSGSYYAHISAALFGALFVYFSLKFIDEADAKSALIAGAALGAIGVIRTFDVFVFLLPFTVELLGKAQKKHYYKIPWVVLGGAPFLLALMYYNYKVTGNPLTQVIQWGTTMRVSILHAEDENGRIFGLMDALRITPLRFGEFFEWTSPAFMLMYGLAFCARGAVHRLRFYDFILPSTVLLYMAFPSSAGPRFGPRYYFEAYPFMALTVAWLCVQLRDGVRIFSVPRFDKFITGLVSAHIITGAIGLVILSYFMHLVVNERMDFLDRAASMNLSHAVVLVSTGTSGTYSTSLPGELLRNGINYNDDIIYSRDDNGDQAKAKSLFPDRRFYVYAWPPGQKESSLTPLN